MNSIISTLRTFLGWLRSGSPTWGSIPVPAQWVFTSLGVNLFIACAGISAGPRAMAALQQAGRLGDFRE
ncbi:MAG: hypothetical protein KAR44_04465 [Candidatus Aegiribacteria sp.]|nr:hypothetical protein [Candidatus Aegiribacteria sp.]